MQNNVSCMMKYPSKTKLPIILYNLFLFIFLLPTVTPSPPKRDPKTHLSGLSSLPRSRSFENGLEDLGIEIGMIPYQGSLFFLTFTLSNPTTCFSLRGMVFTITVVDWGI